MTGIDTPAHVDRPRVDWHLCALVAVAIAAYIALCARADFLADDAFISFRYARNLVRGLGLVFDPGARVEGYTNFLLVVILAGLNRAGLDMVMAGRLVSAVAGGTCIVLAAVLARRTLGHVTWLAAATAALVAVNPYLVVWAGSGLETTLFAALLLLSLLPLAGVAVTARRFLVSSGCALLLALTRPEGVLLYAILVAGVVLSSRAGIAGRARAVAPGVPLFAVAGGTYFVWRWHYFGTLLPNTYAAKSSLTIEQILRGLLYVWRFFASPFNVLAAPLAVFGAEALWRRGQRLPVLLLIAALAVIIAEGGDGLPMYRFLVPAVPLLALCSVAGAAAFARAGGAAAPSRLRWVVLPAVLVLSLFPARDEQYGLFLNQRNHEIPDWRRTGETLRRLLPPDSLVAVEPIGAIGWYSDLPIVDMLGLTDPTIARAPLDPRVQLAGHRKHDGRYVLARRPVALLLGNVLVNDRPSLSDTRPFFWDPDITARERDVFEQPAFRLQYSLASVAVGGGRYLHFFIRNDRREVLDPRH